ncbi:MAG: metallophosphoesterase family protein [Candidatus Falkowbacteria bacterium]|nr:metallophosphoesterase family protein [Candidatus Falkowbacteria bacterium]
MLIAIISDIHDNIANLKKCLDWCRRNEVEKIIQLGDITTLETINYLAENFPGEIFMVSGNLEIYRADELAEYKYKNIRYSGEIDLREIGGLNIGFCHEPKNIKSVQKLASTAPDFIFYGHTHKPWLEHNGETIIANPGNVSGTFHQATFAVLDTTAKKLDLKIIADLK